MRHLVGAKGAGKKGNMLEYCCCGLHSVFEAQHNEHNSVDGQASPDLDESKS